MNKNISIVIDGAVGAGKSTLMSILEQSGFTSFPEPVVDNPLLDKFYYDKARYAFPLQIFFLNKRFAHLKSTNGFKKVALDRSIYGDEIFAKMLNDSGKLSNDEFAIYKELLENMLEHCKPPTLMIYLQISVDEAINRIKKRGRDYELVEKREYWEDLNARYRSFFSNYNRSPLLVIDVSNLDFENNPQHRQLVVGKINNKLKEIGQQLQLNT